MDRLRGALVVQFQGIMKILFCVVVLAFLGLMLLVPLSFLFQEAFRHGVGVWFQWLHNPDVRSATRITLLVCLFTVPCNIIFGIAAAWATTRFHFPGKNILLTIIDLPFSVSPVISGFVYILLYGMNGLLGAFLEQHNIHIIFALPGIVLVTMFVTVPFVAKELIPLMTEQGCEEEEAGLILGASGWQIVRRITIPNVKWGLLNGILLCSARSIGEFGAVSVISGHIRGKTNTLPLHVEVLYSEYNFTGAFATASLMALFSLVAIVMRTLFERNNIDEE